MDALGWCPATCFAPGPVTPPPVRVPLRLSTPALPFSAVSWAVTAICTVFVRVCVPASAAGRDNRHSKSALATPGAGAYNTTSGFRLLSTTESAPLPSFGIRTPPPVAASIDAGVGLPHPPAGLGASAYTLLPRRQPLPSSTSTPGPALVEDDVEKARRVKNLDRSRIKFGIKPKAWSKPAAGDTPGPEYVPPSSIGARPVTFGIRHAVVGAGSSTPGPGEYDIVSGMSLGRRSHIAH